MELFVKVYFWIAVVGVVLRVLVLGYVDYPRQISKGADSISLLVGLPFLAWAAYLVWA